MRKKLLFLLPLIVLFGAGCLPGTNDKKTATVLVSSEDKLKYCNGENMDSAGYRKTITQKKEIELPEGNLTGAQYAKAVLSGATDGMCRDVIGGAEITIDDTGALNIPPTDGWAGISIVMCSCRPEIEVNGSRIPGVNRVTWGN